MDLGQNLIESINQGNKDSLIIFFYKNQYYQDYNSSMSMFYQCYQKIQNTTANEKWSKNATKVQEDEQINLKKITKFLTNLMIKESSMSAKIYLSKLVKYLDSISHLQSSQILRNSLQKDNKQNFYPSNTFVAQNSQISQRVQSSLKSNRNNSASNSNLFQEISQPKILKNVQTSNSQMLSSFQFRSVETRNFLDDPYQHYNYNQSKVKFRQQVQKWSSNSIKGQSQNGNYCFLEKILNNLIIYLNEQRLLVIPQNALGTIKQEEFQFLIDEFKQNYNFYRGEKQKKVRELQEKICTLESQFQFLNSEINQINTLKKSAIRPSKSQQVQTCDDGLEKQLQVLSYELSHALQKKKNLQLILYMRDQEISSLKVVINELQNKIDKYSQIRTKSKSYKNFFERELDELRNTTV